MTLILRKVRFMFVRTFIEQPDNKFFLSAARGAKPRSAGYPTPQKKLIKPRTDSMRIRSQKDSRRIAEGWQKNSRRTSLMIYPFNIRLPPLCYPNTIRLLFVCDHWKENSSRKNSTKVIDGLCRDLSFHDE